MTPNTVIKLCNVPFSNYQDVVTFSDKSAQESYMISKSVKDFSNVTYQRKDHSVRCNGVYEDFTNVNYCMYQNSNYGSKWFYAFIEKVEYVNPQTTQIFLKTDVYQTWQFDFNFNKCFVEREHVAKSEDIEGKHTISENVPIGYYQNKLLNEPPFDYSEPRFLIGCKVSQGEGSLLEGVTACGNTFSCGVYLAENIEVVNELINTLETVMTNNVLWVQTVPKLATQNVTTLMGGLVQNGGAVGSQIVSFSENFKSLNGYLPRNKKLLCYPYNYLTASNGEGSVMEYPLEMFLNRVPMFDIKAELSCSPQLVCFPVAFEGESNHYEKKLSCGTFPTLPFQNDNREYYNMTKSFAQVSQGIQFLNGALTPNPITAINNSINTLMSNAQMDDSFQRNRATYNGSSTSGIMQSMRKVGFYFYQRSLTSEYAQIIDDYFDKYGYKCLRLKHPNLNNRSNWNYVKTVECNLYGDIPQTDIKELESMFNNGVTLWHNPSSIYDYSQANN